MTRPDERPRRWSYGLALAVLTTLLWIVLTGSIIQQRHNVPSIAEFKGKQANVAACVAPDVRRVNDCLDLTYSRELAEWRNEMGTIVILPPMLAWILALLHSLGTDYGLFGRRQRA